MKRVLVIGLVAVLVFIVALLPRVLDLGAILSPDEPQWERNTLGFRQGVATRTPAALYQQPHPGITTMWLAAPVITANSWAVRRLPQAVTIAGLIVVAAALCWRLWGAGPAVAAGLFLAINPLFVAHSRVLAMDALLAIFMLLTMLCLLVYLEECRRRWLVLAAVTTALAILSKLAGMLLIPFTAIILAWRIITRQQRVGIILRDAGWWSVAFLATAIIVLPTLITDFGVIVAGSREFFTTEHYRQAVHALGPSWYPEAFGIWSTPLQLVGVALLPTLVVASARLRRSGAWLLLLAILFFLELQYSIKKGDRYLLPDFLLLDVLAALTIAAAWPTVTKRLRWPALRRVLSAAVILLVLGAFGWQVRELHRLHPYTLAYRNPFFRQLAEGRTMGWGEGLDLAAHYLNRKPGSENLLVVSYYESSFDHQFIGQVTSAERLAKETVADIGAQYVVLYRTMEGRAPDRWETKVLAEFASYAPEQVITLNGETYAWIYAIPLQRDGT